jgi:peptide deformylase
MAVFPIRRFGDPVLRRRASEVEAVDDSVRKLMRDLEETMEHAAGAGLAAPQIGVSKRVFFWRYEEGRGALANPQITDRRGEVEGDEACLSLPGLLYPVLRSEWIRVEALNESGEKVSFEIADWPARIMQHEVDHLDGVLFIDRLTSDLARQAKRALREQALGLEPASEPSAVL